MALPSWANLALTALTVGYFIGAAVLLTRTWRYHTEPRRWPRAFDIFRPQVFTPEGQPARLLALRFYVGGGLLLGALYLLALMAG